MALVIRADVVLTAEGPIEGAAVLVDGGLVRAVTPASDAPAGARVIDAAGLTLAPGLIDAQVNGSFGADFTRDPTTMWTVGEQFAARGVTAFVPTIISSTRAEREGARGAFAAGAPAGHRGALPLGLHFEGPLLNPDARGAHDPGLLREPAGADADVAGWSAAGGVLVATLAPELPGALDLVRSLVAAGVRVSAGHSLADHAAARAAFDAGVSAVTHLFNAMAPLHHRAPGLAGAALADDRVTLGLICDGIHVHPDLVAVVAAAAGDRVALVTDAVAAAGMSPGRYVLGGADVAADGDAVRLAQEGTLAGSSLTADEAVRRYLRYARRSAAAGVAAMSATPARFLGLADRGFIGPGARADFVLFGSHMEVTATFVAGQQVHGPWD